MHEETNAMSRTDKATGSPAEFESGRALWQCCQLADAPVDEVARFLDLAAFVDGLLDEEDHDRVAAAVGADPAAADDIAAARQIARGLDIAPDLIERIVARARPLAAAAAGEPDATLRFALPVRRRVLPGLARWASLAAAIVLAGWLGFAMGSGASLELTQPAEQIQAGPSYYLPELLDPSTGFLHDLAGGQQT
jgi:anti-sigma factor RsiW